MVRVLAWHVQGPGFHPWHHKKEKTACPYGRAIADHHIEKLAQQKFLLVSWGFLTKTPRYVYAHLSLRGAWYTCVVPHAQQGED